MYQFVVVQLKAAVSMSAGRSPEELSPDFGHFLLPIQQNEQLLAHGNGHVGWIKTIGLRQVLDLVETMIENIPAPKVRTGYQRIKSDTFFGHILERGFQQIQTALAVFQSIDIPDGEAVYVQLEGRKLGKEEVLKGREFLSGIIHGSSGNFIGKLQVAEKLVEVVLKFPDRFCKLGKIKNDIVGLLLNVLVQRNTEVQTDFLQLIRAQHGGVSKPAVTGFPVNG